MFNGAFAVSNLSGTVIQPGIGQPTPSLLTVVRPLPGGGHIPIRVDLNRAVRDSHERILVQAGDFLILQETPGEALSRYVTQVFNVPFLWKFLQTPHLFAAATFGVPGGTAPPTISPLTITNFVPAPATGTGVTTPVISNPAPRSGTGP
jgi:hypothetical protein